MKQLQLMDTLLLCAPHNLKILSVHMSGKASNIGVMVVDDHDLVRRGFASLLSAQQGIEVVAEVNSGELAIEQCRQQHDDIDVILMDVNMPGIGGIEATRKIKRLYPGTKVIVVANLKPRKMKFGVSEGMILASGPGKADVFMLNVDEGAVPGQRVH